MLKIFQGLILHIGAVIISRCNKTEFGNLKFIAIKNLKFSIFFFNYSIFFCDTQQLINVIES